MAPKHNTHINSLTAQLAYRSHIPSCSPLKSTRDVSPPSAAGRERIFDILQEAISVIEPDGHEENSKNQDSRTPSLATKEHPSARQ